MYYLRKKNQQNIKPKEQQNISVDLLDLKVDGVTSISLLLWYGWKDDTELRSPTKGSGLCVPVELALVPSPPL